MSLSGSVAASHLLPDTGSVPSLTLQTSPTCPAPSRTPILHYRASPSDLAPCSSRLGRPPYTQRDTHTHTLSLFFSLSLSLTPTLTHISSLPPAKAHHHIVSHRLFFGRPQLEPGHLLNLADDPGSSPARSSYTSSSPHILDSCPTPARALTLAQRHRVYFSPAHHGFEPYPHSRPCPTLSTLATW